MIEDIINPLSTVTILLVSVYAIVKAVVELVKLISKVVEDAMKANEALRGST
jgi:hypothetical protein